MDMSGWRILGFAGQAMFASRFVVQWIVSERQRRSVIPTYFWYASLVGSLALLAYAIHIREPVFILGQAFGFVVYGRNIVLGRRREEITRG